MKTERLGLCKTCKYDPKTCNPGRVTAQGEMNNISRCGKYHKK